MKKKAETFLYATLFDKKKTLHNSWIRIPTKYNVFAFDEFQFDS